MEYINSLSQPFVDDALLQRETQNWRSRLIDYKVLYEVAPEPFTPAPFILSGEVYQRMAQFLEPLASLVEKCVALYAVSPEVQGFFGFPKRLCQLVARQAAQSPPGWYCRFDFALSDSGVPEVMEFNGDCPAGLLLQYYYQMLCRNSSLANQYAARATLRTLIEDPDFVPNHIKALKGPDRRTVAILNSRHRTLRNEIELFRITLTRAGIPCVVGQVEDVRFRDGRVWLGPHLIDVALTKFDPQLEAEEKPPIGSDWQEIAEFERAIHEGKILVLNGLAYSIIAESKETLALLHCDWFQRFLSPSERALVQACIPVTIRLDQLDAGRLQAILENKDAWVLKKCMDTRGRSVIVGSEEPSDVWASRVASVHREVPRRYVIQRRVRAFTSRVSATFKSLPPLVHTVFGGFVVRGRMAGLLVRSSESLVVNVGQRGFVQPHLIV